MSRLRGMFIGLMVGVLAGCASSGPVAPKLEKEGTPVASTVPSTVVWESTPRSLGPGTGGQMSIWASEAINMIQAVPAEGGMNLVFKKSHNEASSFGRAIPVSQVEGEVSAHGENNPQLRRGPGIGIYAAWQGGKEIKFARSMSFGHSFLPPVSVSDYQGEEFRSFLTMEAAPTGDVYVVWIDGRDKETEPPGQASLYLARSEDQGATFSSNIKIAGNICPCCRPSLTFGPDGILYLAWRHVAEGHRRVVVVASSKDKGTTWSTPVTVHPPGWVINGCAHSGPVVKMAGGKLTVVWYTAAGGKAQLLMAQSADGGKTFSPVRALHGVVHDPNHPHLTVVGEEVWALFQGRHPEHQDGWGPILPWMTRIGADGSVSPPESLPATGDVSYPQMSLGNGGRLYALWTQFGDKGPEVILCRGRMAHSESQ